MTPPTKFSPSNNAIYKVWHRNPHLDIIIHEFALLKPYVYILAVLFIVIIILIVVEIVDNSATEVPKHRYGAEVALVPAYNAKPDSPGRMLLKRDANGEARWSRPFVDLLCDLETRERFAGGAMQPPEISLSRAIGRLKAGESHLRK